MLANAHCHQIPLSATVFNSSLTARSLLHVASGSLTFSTVYAQALRLPISSSSRMVGGRMLILLRRRIKCSPVLCRFDGQPSSLPLPHSLSVSTGPRRTSQFLSRATKLVSPSEPTPLRSKTNFG